MNRRKSRLCIVPGFFAVAFGVCLTGAATSSVARQTMATPASPTTTPATYPVLSSLPDDLTSRVAEVNRLRREVRTDLSEVRRDASAAIKQLVPNYAVLQSPETRQGMASELSKNLRLIVQIDWALTLAGAQGETRDTELYGAFFSPRDVGMYNAAMLAVAGDDDAVAQMVKFSDWKPESIALMADFLKADAEGQKKVVEAIVTRLKAKDETDTAPMDAAVMILRREFSTDVTLTDPLYMALKEAPLSPLAKSSFARYEVQIKQKGAVSQLGKPIDIRGPLVDGSTFSTTSLLGKVVIVDFWATWCGPCKAELPRIKAIRAKYKDQGLEVVGVSCDISKPQLEAYLQEHPDMNYPQLFDEKAAAERRWNPIASGFGISAIPALYLIDRKGVLRSVDARSKLEAEVEKLLAE